MHILSLYENKECINVIESLNILKLFLALNSKLKLYITLMRSFKSYSILQISLPFGYNNEE